MEQTKRQLKKPPKLEDGLGRPCSYCGTGGSCRSRCAVCSLHAASACAYKLCKTCCTTRGVCDYHKSQPPTKRRSASEPNSELAQSASGNQKLTAISSIDLQRGNERDSVTGGESERIGKNDLDGLKVFSDDHNNTKTNTPLPESGHDILASVLPLSATPSATLGGATSRRSRARTVSESDLDDPSTNLGDKRRKKDQDEKDDEWRVYNNVTLHNEMVTKKSRK